MNNNKKYKGKELIFYRVNRDREGKRDLEAGKCDWTRARNVIKKIGLLYQIKRRKTGLPWEAGTKLASKYKAALAHVHKAVLPYTDGGFTR